MANRPDGAGGRQNFWGNWRIDRGGNYKVTEGQCKTYMADIYNSCGGFGGWKNEWFGTVSRRKTSIEIRHLADVGRSLGNVSGYRLVPGGSE